MPEVFEDLGGDTRQSLEGFWRQWAKNFRVTAGEKGDKKFNPRGLGTQLATGLGGPGIGLVSSIPFAMLAKNLFGMKGSIADLLGIGPNNKFFKFDTGPNSGRGLEPLSGQATEGGAALSGQQSVDPALLSSALFGDTGFTDSGGQYADGYSEQGPNTSQATAMEIFATLMSRAGYASATGDPLDPNARTVAVGAGTDRSSDPFGGGAGPGAGRGGPGGTDMGQFFGGRFGRGVGSFGGGKNRDISSSLFKF